MTIFDRVFSLGMVYALAALVAGLLLIVGTFAVAYPYELMTFIFVVFGISWLVWRVPVVPAFASLSWFAVVGFGRALHHRRSKKRS